MRESEARRCQKADRGKEAAEIRRNHYGPVCIVSAVPLQFVYISPSGCKLFYHNVWTDHLQNRTAGFDLVAQKLYRLLRNNVIDQTRVYPRKVEGSTLRQNTTYVRARTYPDTAPKTRMEVPHHGSAAASPECTWVFLRSRAVATAA